MNKEIEQLKQVLSKEGLRFTNQRESIWNEIISNEDHRDADDIFWALKQKGLSVSRATVYRTIDVLVKNNMVRKLDMGLGPSKYENKICTDHHDHMICRRCGRIEEFVNDEIEDLQETIATEYKFKLERHNHQLFGICKDCQ